MQNGFQFDTAIDGFLWEGERASVVQMKTVSGTGSEALIAYDRALSSYLESSCHLLTSRVEKLSAQLAAGWNLLSFEPADVTYTLAFPNSSDLFYYEPAITFSRAEADSLIVRRPSSIAFLSCECPTGPPPSQFMFEAAVPASGFPSTKPSGIDISAISNLMDATAELSQIELDAEAIESLIKSLTAFLPAVDVFDAVTRQGHRIVLALQRRIAKAVGLVRILARTSRRRATVQSFTRIQRAFFLLHGAHPPKDFPVRVGTRPTGGMLSLLNAAA